MGIFRSITKKLEQLKKLEKHNDVMMEQLREGILEEVPYIPHQPVIREEAEAVLLTSCQ